MLHLVEETSSLMERFAIFKAARERQVHGFAQSDDVHDIRRAATNAFYKKRDPAVERETRYRDCKVR